MPQMLFYAYFNPRFPWGKRRGNIARKIRYYVISIHASRGGSDFNFRQHQSRGFISIHASRGGSDAGDGDISSRARLFQSTLPVGEATARHRISRASKAFQSTLPVGEATAAYAAWAKENNISIHASRGGSDRASPSSTAPATNFNPRFPWGKRQQKGLISGYRLLFQSTLPVGEATRVRPSNVRA